MGGILAGKKLFPFKFVILISGFRSRATIHEELMQKDVIKGIDSFHVIGLSDTIITPDRTRDLAEVFESHEIWTHSGGHIPDQSWPVEEVRRFLLKQKESLSRLEE
eukprot:TRINITY_DN3895_c0_g1_i1.p1 TRINITY_DN3895_c0_g1~~TRINITY_DN3895_c0_g1_i1.p1  ORF type:complete len:106 (+),score=36.58 TRINITY_DN3895_c0_g1_i1:523-840(+)